jgi:toxin ParE1/3/4
LSLTLVKHRKLKRDALLIFTRFGEDNITAAKNFLRALDQDMKKLVDFPGLGAMREFDHPKLQGLRSLPISGFTNYLIFYRATETEVQALRVIHGARDLEQALLE